MNFGTLEIWNPSVFPHLYLSRYIRK